jgi:hypothetical protein
MPIRHSAQRSRRDLDNVALIELQLESSLTRLLKKRT